MIRLTRPAIPRALADKAPAALQKLEKAWAEQKPIKPDSAVYAHPSVKQALRQAQHNKCAYCETLNPTSPDVVEHYRPKSGWRQNRREALQKPEYFWLAYAWENLVFACNQCNDGGHKQNLFPLANPDQRATAQERDLSKEKPLILDPYGSDDPEDHIAWSRDVPRPRNRSRRGKATIETFRLDEPSLLLQKRRDYLNEAEALLGAIEELPRTSAKRAAARAVFLAKLGPGGSWSAMLKANLGPRIAAL